MSRDEALLWFHKSKRAELGRDYRLLLAKKSAARRVRWPLTRDFLADVEDRFVRSLPNPPFTVGQLQRITELAFEDVVKSIESGNPRAPRSDRQAQDPDDA